MLTRAEGGWEGGSEREYKKVESQRGGNGRGGGTLKSENADRGMRGRNDS